MKKLLATLLCATTMTLSVAACGSAESSSTQKDEGTASTQSAENSQSTDGFKIGFTDNYNGNSYHQAMEKYMTEAADKLKADGQIGGTDNRRSKSGCCNTDFTDRRFYHAGI